MNRFGFNINLTMSPEEIRKTGEEMLGTGQYHAIEVTYYEHLEGIDTTAYNEAILEIVEKYSPEVFVHIVDFNLSEENSVLRKAILDEAVNCINYTKMIKGKSIVIHSGNHITGQHSPLAAVKEQIWGKDSEKTARDRAWELSVAMMQNICDAGKDMMFYTENINEGNNTRTTDQLIRYLNDVGRDNLKMVFDVGHCHLAGYGIVPEIKKAKGILAHLHIHDNHGPHNEGWLDEHLPLGEGTTDFEEFVKTLLSVGYEGIYMMELRHPTPENLKVCRAVLEETLGEEEQVSL